MAGVGLRSYPLDHFLRFDKGQHSQRGPRHVRNRPHVRRATRTISFQATNRPPRTRHLCHSTPRSRHHLQPQLRLQARNDARHHFRIPCGTIRHPQRSPSQNIRRQQHIHELLVACLGAGILLAITGDFNSELIYLSSKDWLQFDPSRRRNLVCLHSKHPRHEGPHPSPLQ